MKNTQHHIPLSRRARWAACLVVAAMAVTAGAQPGARDVEAPQLKPGDGFDEQVALPKTDFGDLDPSAPLAIARWDVVPHQTVREGFEIGVVAFHISGIDRVEFSADGGPWTAVDRPTPNPRTGVTEYWVRLGAHERDGKPIEVRAVAYPKKGFPRLLAGPMTKGLARGEYSLQLFPEQVQTPAPLRVDSPDALAEAFAAAPDGGEIHLAPGEYDFTELNRDRDDQRWLTIRPQPGVERGKVVIRPSERRNIPVNGQRVRWVDVTLDVSRILRLVTPRGAELWFDRCEWFDSNGWEAEYDPYYPVTHPETIVYLTDGYIHDTIYAAVNLHLVRGCKLHRISGDAFINNGCVLKCEVDTLDGSVRKHHSDLFQYWASKDDRVLENRIVYGVKATNVWSQQFFMRTGGGAEYRDFAFVDIAVEMIPNRGRPIFKSQLYCNHQHVIFRNVQTELDLLLRVPGKARQGEGYQATHVVFDRCSLPGRTLQMLTTGKPAGVVLIECRQSGREQR
jgi:hypothetical protein